METGTPAASLPATAPPAASLPGGPSAWRTASPTRGPGQPRIRVLLVEDDPDDARMTYGALRASGRFEAVHVKTAAEAIEAASKGRFQLLLLDFRLPDMSGVELCRRMRAQGVTAPIVMLSSVESDLLVRRSSEAGAQEFLVKHLTYTDNLAGHLERVAEAAHGSP